MSTPKVIFLDFDGTLLEVSHIMREALGRTFEAYGKERWNDEQARANEGVSEINLFPKIFGDEADAAKQTFYQKYDEVAAEIEPQLKPGGAEFIKYVHQLRQNDQIKHLGIITNKPTKLVENELQRLGIASKTFDTIIGRDNVPVDENNKPITKPSRVPYNVAMESCEEGEKIRPNQVLYIGDTVGDKAFADNVGMKFIGVGNSFAPKVLAEGEQLNSLNDVRERLQRAYFNQQGRAIRV